MDRLFARIDAKYGRKLEGSKRAALEPLLVSPDEFGSLIGTTGEFVRKRIREGEIKAVRVSDLLRIPIEEAGTLFDVSAARQCSRAIVGGCRML